MHFSPGPRAPKPSPSRPIGFTLRAAGVDPSPPHTGVLGGKPWQRQSVRQRMHTSDGVIVTQPPRTPLRIRPAVNGRVTGLGPTVSGVRAVSGVPAVTGFPP